MNSPSSELQEMANAPKPDVEAIYTQWGNLFSKLKIASGLFCSVETVFDKLNMFCLDEDPESDQDVFQVLLYPTVKDMVEGRGGMTEHPIWCCFYSDGTAKVGNEEDENLCQVMRDFRDTFYVEGKARMTWEELVRELFKLEKLMLSQVPKVPSDLKP
jgi:hypothetical protein